MLTYVSIGVGIFIALTVTSRNQKQMTLIDYIGALCFVAVLWPVWLAVKIVLHKGETK